jgi:AraC family transcriptional regulator
MRIIRSFEFDHCTIRQVSYEGSLYMPPHIDDESKIGIVLEGSLIERSKNGSVEAKRNSVVIKPNHAVHENVFGNKGVNLLAINFKKDYSLPESLHNWDWFEDPRVSFSTYKLWYSIKSTRNDKELHRHLNAFIQSLETVKKIRQNTTPAWLQSVAELLKSYSLDSETIGRISQQIKISRVHLSRSFKKHHSISAIKYRHYARMSNLLYCLISTNKSLAETSYECGFSDQSQMSRIVLKETGYTANALRLLLQKS